MVELAILWALSLAAVFVIVHFRTPQVSRKHEIWVVIAVATVANLVPILLLPQFHGIAILDIQNYEQTAQSVLDGRDVYLANDLQYHPYPPFQMYVLALAKLIANATGVPFFTIVRIPNAAANVATAALIVLAARRCHPDTNAFQSGLLFAVCPFPVLVAVYHGQFDAISALFASAAVFFVVSKRQLDRDFSAVALALGVLQKFWPAFLGLTVLSYVRDPRAIVRYLAISGGACAAAIVFYILVFDSSPDVLVDHTVRYSTPFPRAGGFPLVLSRLSLDGLYSWWVDNGLYPTVALVVAVSAFTIAKRAHAFVASVAVLCALFVLVPDGASYHNVWVLPFGLIASHRLPVAIIALCAAAQYLIVGYVGGSLYYPPFEGPGLSWVLDHHANLIVAVWVTFAAWLAWIVWRLSDDDPKFVQPAPEASSGDPPQTPVAPPRS